MTDKVREAFEEWMDNPSLCEKDNKPFNMKYGNYICSQVKLDWYKWAAGYKSRDAEIEELKEDIGIEKAINVSLQKEIKKLRETLEEIGNYLYVDTDGIGDLDEARRIIEEVLKDGK